MYLTCVRVCMAAHHVCIKPVTELLEMETSSNVSSVKIASCVFYHVFGVNVKDDCKNCCVFS